MRVKPERAYGCEVRLCRERPVLRCFDLDHLRGLHRRLFADVYAWAGELRTVNLTKGPTVLALAEHVEAKARRLSRPATGRWLPDLHGTASMPKPAPSSPT